jgi:P4 family phage/plasmid primase-like protien
MSTANKRHISDTESPSKRRRLNSLAASHDQVSMFRHMMDASFCAPTIGDVEQIERLHTNDDGGGDDGGHEHDGNAEDAGNSGGNDDMDDDGGAHANETARLSNYEELLMHGGDHGLATVLADVLRDDVAVISTASGCACYIFNDATALWDKRQGIFMLPRVTSTLVPLIQHFISLLDGTTQSANSTVQDETQPYDDADAPSSDDEDSSPATEEASDEAREGAGEEDDDEDEEDAQPDDDVTAPTVPLTPDQEAELGALHELKTKVQSARCCRDVWTLATSMLFRPELQTIMNRTKHVLPTQGKRVVDLSTGTIRERTRDDNFSFELPVRVLTDASGNIRTDLPEAHRFFMSVMNNDDDMTAYFQKTLGYTMTGEMTDRSLWIWYGQGSNGKSMVAKLLKMVLGPMYCTVSRDVMLKNHQSSSSGAATPHLLPLVVARMGMFAESESDDKLNEALLKSISGTDAITVRALYGAQFEFNPIVVMFLQTNYKPSFNVDDQAMVDRLKLIPFLARFVRNPQKEAGEVAQDDAFMARLQTTHLDEFFTWLVLGARAWYANPDLTMPALAQTHMDTYVDDLDALTQFISAKCDVGETYSVRRSLFNAAFKSFCSREGFTHCTSAETNAAMLSRDTTFVNVNGIKKWQGVRLAPDAPADDDTLDETPTLATSAPATCEQ